MTPQAIETAPRDGGWILAHVPKNGVEPYNQPWLVLTWGDGPVDGEAGWCDDDGNQHEPTEWVALPDPQPKPTGWSPAVGKIMIHETDGTGWTDGKGNPIEAPYRWWLSIERPDGTTDEYREPWPFVRLEDAQARAERYRHKFGLPIECVPLKGSTVVFLPAVTRQ